MRKFNTISPVLIFVTVMALWACSGNKDENNNEKHVEEIKNDIPEELKDTVTLLKEEESALDKLNSVTDSGSKK